MKTYKKKADVLRELKKVQAHDGNWDYNSYMTGMYNGIELSMAVIENRDPIYKTNKQRIISRVKKHLKYFIDMLIIKFLDTDIDSVIEIARRI